MMATASKKSADYDPVEEALDMGYKFGKEDERKHREPHRAQARRGGFRAGQAHARREAEAKRKGEARERELREQKAKTKGLAQLDDVLARERRKGYRAGGADVRRATRTGVPSGASGARSESEAALRAPNFRLGGDDGYSKSTSAKFIIICVSLAAVSVVSRDAVLGVSPQKTTVKTAGGETITVPTHLRSFAGVFLAGTVCLIVNEFNPVLGSVMGGLLLLDSSAFLFGKDGLVQRIGASFAGKIPGAPPPVNIGTPGATIPQPGGNPNGLVTGPTGSHWVQTKNGWSLEPNPPQFTPGPQRGGGTGA